MELTMGPWRLTMAQWRLTSLGGLQWLNPKTMTKNYDKNYVSKVITLNNNIKNNNQAKKDQIQNWQLKMMTKMITSNDDINDRIRMLKKYKMKL